MEVILTLLAWKVCNPHCMHLTRGNHESRTMNKMYGFEGEVLAKYDDQVYDLFQDVFNKLPLAYVLNSKVLVLHGVIALRIHLFKGLFSRDGVTLDDIRKLDRFKEIPDTGLMADMLWSDPTKVTNIGYLSAAQRKTPE